MVVATVLCGCAQLVPQTVALRTGWPEGVAQATQISNVPFFPQDQYQCGPAALATLLAFTGVQVTPEPLVDLVYLPVRQGSLQLEMLAAPRRYDRIAYPLAPRYADLLSEVAAGNPVLVLQDVGTMFTDWHYAVVTAFDYDAAELYLRSGTEPRVAIPFTAFERTWIKSGYWAMVVLPPDRIAATATEERWMRAILAMERSASARAIIRAYATALQRWPDNMPAAIGLANQHHAAGDLAKAAAVLRQALVRSPESIIVMNNLAQTLSDQGYQGEALALIERASDPKSPFASEVRATRQLILQRMNPQAGSKPQALP